MSGSLVPTQFAGEIDTAGYYDLMNSVAERSLRGMNPGQIAKELGIKRAQVAELMDLWENVAKNSREIQDRAGVAVYGADQHFSMVIGELWGVVEEADQNSDYKAKTTTLKTIADVEGKRIDMLQKAGLLENQDMARQVVENEKKQEQIMEILREVAADCDHCRAKILKKLSNINGDGVGVPA